MPCHTLCDCRSFEATTRMENLHIRKCCHWKQLCITVTKHKAVLLLPEAPRTRHTRVSAQTLFLALEMPRPIVGITIGIFIAMCPRTANWASQLPISNNLQ
jgi:hypothetical protein